MDIFSVIMLAGGLAFFLYGMEVMSSGLKKMAGGSLQSSLERMTSNPLLGVLVGAGFTGIIQSSSAVTVMLVGLVNSGMMHFGRTIGVIMGSNIGTTITAWLLSMTGIDGDAPWLRLLKPENFSLVLALAGIIMIMAARRQKHKDMGSIFVGFAVLMYGMEMMGGAVEPLADMPEFSRILTAFNNPLLGVLAGAVFTGIVQSSSASVGILMALSVTGEISFGMAIPIIMGQNIGTCVTALISSIGVGREAKRVAAVHVSFNLIGTAIWLSIFYAANAVNPFPFMNDPINMVSIATVHSIFNLATTALLLPFTKQLERLACILVRGKGDEQHILIDERLLETPSVAIDECSRLSCTMAHAAADSLLAAMELCDRFDRKKADEVLAGEDKLDSYEDKLGSFLVKASARSLTDRDSREASKLLHAIGDFERIGDHAVNLVGAAEEMADKKVTFSDAAVKELSVLTAAIREILNISMRAYCEGNVGLAEQVEPLEQVVDRLIAELRSSHVARLQAGECTIEQGFILSDMLNNYERVSDHCSNIAVAVIEVGLGEFDTHRYLSDVKSGKSESFNVHFERYNNKYSLD